MENFSRDSKEMRGNLHTLSIWFERTKIGKVQVGKALPELSIALGVERYKNNQIRPTTIETLKRAGFSDREIMNITGN